MFKKAATVAFKGETRLRGKETKKLRDAVATRLGGESSAATLLPSKAEVVVRKSGGGTTVQFIFAEDECLFVQPDGRAATGDGELVPTLPALWKAGAATLLPVVLIQRPVAKFVFGGANVMAPGIITVLPADGGQGTVREGSLVAVRALGNPSACAVGRLRMPAESLGRRGVKGEAVEVLLFFGDALWEACGAPRPAGFLGDQVAATDDGEEQRRLSSSDAPAAPPDDSDETASGPAEAAEANPEAFSPPPRQADRRDSAEEKKEPEEQGQDDDVDEPAEAALSPEDMTRALEECFLQAATTRVKDKDLPMAGNMLYAQHLRPCRRAGSNVDVKSSAQKKLVAFLAHLEDLGWLGLKKNSADPVITRIFRDHPDLREWKPWPRGATAEAAAAEDGAASVGSRGGPAATIEVEPAWQTKKLKALLDALGTSAPQAGAEGSWSRSECLEGLKQYADSRSLWLKSNRKRIGPDDLLLGLLGEAAVESGDQQQCFSLEALADRVLATLPPCHRVATPQGGAAGGIKRSVRTGKPPVVQVRTDTRRGHSVTLVHGLEAYGVDMEALGACLQKALACSATVESQPQVAVMVQGFWDVAVVEWLGKIGIPADSIQHQVKKGQGQKKAKQGSNIVRS